MTGTTQMTKLDPTAIESLRIGFRGEVIEPQDPAYEITRRVWNGSIDRYPAIVARCRGVADIKAALAFARANGLVTAVRGGGHNIAGFGTCDGGMVIDLSLMRSVRVDPETRTATAEPGVVGADLDRETQTFGLATTLGVMSTTGIAGLTLGGGIGWLHRKHGYTCDNLIEAQVLTADGELVRASDHENPDLFWGLRGGGGNFGIVTSFTYRLHPVGPQVFCGPVAWPASETGSVLRHFREFATQMPDELTVIPIMRTAPPAPFLPESVHGTPIVILAGCYSGSIEDGEEAVAALRSFGTPVGDAYAARPYTAFQSMFDASWAPGFRNYWKGEYLADLSDDLLDVFARYAVSHSSPLSDFKFPYLGGAVGRVGEYDTACGFRDAEAFFAINTRWEDPAADEEHIAHSRALFEEVKPFSAGGVYVNFVGDDEGEERVVQSYGDARFDRLRKLKATWDPENVFRLNQNIPPA